VGKPISVFATEGVLDLMKDFWQKIDEADDVGLAPICRNDPDLFFKETIGGNNRDAKQACAMCPLRDPCATYALLAEEKDGVWGGLSPAERRTIRKGLVRERALAAVAETGYYAFKRSKLQAANGHAKHVPRRLRVQKSK
jgi:hypothetical protein